MHVIPLSWLGLAVLAALPAAAEPWNCRFTAECTLDEGCTETGLTLRIIAADHAGDLFVSTVTGDSPVSRLTAQGALPATYAGAARDGMAELLTIETDSTALMTVHLFDGAAGAITYFGTCEGLT